MRVQVSRQFEPVPELAVEARYVFLWKAGEFEQIDLSKRKVKPSGHNSQFDKVEGIDASKVPNSVIAEAQDELKTRASELEEFHD